jgi:hypothetical protein
MYCKANPYHAGYSIDNLINLPTANGYALKITYLLLGRIEATSNEVIHPLGDCCGARDWHTHVIYCLSFIALMQSTGEASFRRKAVYAC